MKAKSKRAKQGTSPRVMSALPASTIALREKKWAVMTSEDVVIGLTHKRAWQIANRLRERGQAHARVVTIAAGLRFGASLPEGRQLSNEMKVAILAL